jgi:hypothetical protein
MATGRIELPTWAEIEAKLQATAPGAGLASLDPLERFIYYDAPPGKLGEEWRARLEAMLVHVSRDTARLDFLESRSNGDDWVARESETGRGYRLHNSSRQGYATARAALDAVMEVSDEDVQEL